MVFVPNIPVEIEWMVSGKANFIYSLKKSAISNTLLEFYMICV